MTVTIELENMFFRASHGCYALEKIVGNNFSVDVTIEAQIGDAAQEDSIENTVNYLTVYELVAVEMSIPSNILENVALRIIDSVYGTFSGIEKVRVKVSKLAPPLGGKIEKVSATLCR